MALNADPAAVQLPRVEPGSAVIRPAAVFLDLRLKIEAEDRSDAQRWMLLPGDTHAAPGIRRVDVDRFVRRRLRLLGDLLLLLRRLLLGRRLCRGLGFKKGYDPFAEPSRQ